MKNGTEIAIQSLADEQDVTLIEDTELSKVVCLKHKNYSGETSPSISCKNCCKIYVDKLTLHNRKNLSSLDFTGTSFEADRKEKQKSIVQKRIRKRSSNFDSSWI